MKTTMDKPGSRSPFSGVDSAIVGVDLVAGAVVAGRYRLDRRLGQGGMGEVWAATHAVTRRNVAMKFIRAPVHARPELRRRFIREARAASAVRHPNVVDVLDVFELDADTPVMVMDLLTGETLGGKLAREQKLEIGEAAAIVLPIVSAVGTAHALGIVHRDLKPDNVFLAESEEGDRAVKVLDFGIAKLSSAAEGETGVTQTGTTLGTPCYMAPEQATGERQLDHKVDIWALGVILYEALSGVRPIEGDTVGQIVIHLMSTGITPLERIAPGLPSDVTAIVGRMLARERTRRPADLREVFDVLRPYTDVRCRTFGAPGSDAQQVSAADLDAVEGSGRHRVIVAADASEDGETVSLHSTRPSTAGPHAVPTHSTRKPRSRLLLGAAVLVAAAVAVTKYTFAIRSPPPPSALASTPPAAARRGGAATGGGGTRAPILACPDAGLNEEVDAAVGTACGFTMPNPAGSGLSNAASYKPNPQDGSIIDNVTGLIWEGAVDPALYRQADAAAYCATKGGDWRLPTRIELVSLVDFTVSNPDQVPAPDPTTLHPMIAAIFQRTPAEKFWTSSPKAGDPTYAWTVGFDFGNTRQKAVTESYRVRCVHRPPSQCSPTGYQVNAEEGTVYDVATGLTWQRAIAGKQQWSDASTYCSAVFGNAWRLPSLTELQTLVDETKENPSIDGNAFPCTPISDYFWTADQYVGDNAWAYYVTFIHGHADTQLVSTPSYVRCVKPL